MKQRIHIMPKKEKQMKLLVFFVLLQFMQGAQSNSYPIPPPYETEPDRLLAVTDRTEYILNSWFGMDAAVRRFSDMIMKNTLPYAFKLISSGRLSANCSRDIINYLRGIAETRTWAYSMIDSSGKLPSGITSGSVSSLGDYVSCLNTKVSNLFEGNFCLVDYQIPLPERRHFKIWAEKVPTTFNITSNDTIIHEFLKWGEDLYMLYPRTSICLPSTCSRDDVQLILDKVDEFTRLGISSSVRSCESNKDKTKATTFDIILILILSSITLIVITATVYDLIRRAVECDSTNEEDKNDSTDFLNFSILANFPMIFQKDENPESIRIFHGMRVITMFWIILSNISLVFYVQAYGSLEQYFNIRKDLMAQFVSGSSVAVETFFFISATLLSYKVFKDEECNKSVGSIFLSRYIRITLPHIVVIAFICLLPLFSSGPLYKEIVGSYSENCRNWGWMNLLYINNYGPGQKMCLNVSWYLSVDTQLFLISLFILVAFKRNPKTIFILAITLLFCGFFGTILSHIIFKLPPTTLLLNLHPDYMIHIWQRSLFLPHFHLPTYSIGLLVGYLLTREKQIEVSKGIKSFLWIASLMAQFSIVFGVYIWNKNGEHPGLFSSVLYGSSHRLIWTLTLAWITLACKANDTSLVSSFLGSEFFVPLSRLSFIMYLTHCVIKVYYVGTASALITYSYTTIFLMFFSLIMFTFIISCLLTVIFISPFKRFENTLMDRWIGKYGTKGH